ncbi:MAG: AI-2E family transporter [Nanoarchaeota archaeon]|nr:AI-2E family transporter [Nanoarchaeota archaeon]
MEETFFKRITTAILLIVLIVLSFFLLKPILLSIVLGLILAFVFSPVHDRLVKIVKSKNLSVSIICIIIILLIVIPFWFLVPILIDQSIKTYLAAQQMDFVTPLKSVFPSLFASEEFSQQVGSIIYSFVTNVSNSLMNSFANLILDFPRLLLQISVVFFTFFFVLRDKEQLVLYIKSLLPFPPEIEKKLFDNTKGITSSVIYGQIVVGIIQGIIAGAGFFIFGVSNALVLSLLAVLAGVLPIIATGLVWIPVVIYLLIGGNNFAAIGVALFGLVASTIDNIIKPLIVAKRTSITSPVILIGMIGGLFLFGVLGLILGPLILAYLLVILEVYRHQRVPGLLVKS